MAERVEDHVLEAFISRKYHWKSLNPEQQMSLAIEVKRLRYLIEKHYAFIEDLLEYKEAAGRYRKVISDGDA